MRDLKVWIIVAEQARDGEGGKSGKQAREMGIKDATYGKWHCLFRRPGNIVARSEDFGVDLECIFAGRQLQG
jgi:hypothetical protein